MVVTKEQLEKLRMLVECHDEDNDELGQAARELLPLLDGLAAEPTSERLFTALKTIRFAGRNEHPTAVWMQKVAANAMEPGKWPKQPAEPPVDEQSSDLNADRYRWIRANVDEFLKLHAHGDFPIYAEELDAAVDSMRGGLNPS